MGPSPRSNRPQWLAAEPYKFRFSRFPCVTSNVHRYSLDAEIMRFLSGLLLIFLPAAAAGTGSFDSASRILEARCAGCHSLKSKTSGVSVQDSAAVIAGGNKHG